MICVNSLAISWSSHRREYTFTFWNGFAFAIPLLRINFPFFDKLVNFRSLTIAVLLADRPVDG